MQNTVIDTTKITRVEVIDSEGRKYVNVDVKHAEIQIQDQNRTLKLFIE